MPEIELRPAIATDIPKLIALDHDYTSNFAWQMDVSLETGQVDVHFRQVRLPRTDKVGYPRSAHSLASDWTRRSGLLVAVLNSEVIGYISLALEIAPMSTWATDLVVMRRLRRKGIGSALVLAAEEWAWQHGSNRIVLEMQPKNYPAICLAQKLGFDFSGYADRYFANHDIALFFAKAVR